MQQQKLKTMQKVCNLGCSPNVTLKLLPMSVHESAVRNIIYIHFNSWSVLGYIGPV